MSVKNRRNTATIVNKSRKVAKTPIRVSHSNSSKNSVRQNARWKYLNYSAFVNVRIRGLDNPLRSALSNVYGRKTELHSTRAGARALQELSTRAWYSGPLPRGCDRVLVGLLRGCDRVLVGLPRGCGRVLVGLLRGCGRVVVGLPRGCDRVVVGLLRGCGRVLVGLPRGCGRVLVGLLRGCGRVVVGLPRGCGRVVVGLPRGCGRVLVGLLRGCGRVLFPRHACTSLGMRSSRTLNLEITDPRRIRSAM